MGGRIAARSVLWIVVICTLSAVLGAVMTVFLTRIAPLPRGTADALQGGLAAVEQKGSGPLPGVIDFFKGVIPDNVIAAASNGDVLPLVVFSLLFALALGAISPSARETVVSLFAAISRSAARHHPLGLGSLRSSCFALAFTVGSEAGGAAFAGLGHYVALVSACGHSADGCSPPTPGASRAGRPGAIRRKGHDRPNRRGISTRSSLASLPAMLTAARRSASGPGGRRHAADLRRPVPLDWPAMNAAVAFYVAHWLGLHPTTGQMIAATAVGAVRSHGAVSLPGEISFISSIAPIAWHSVFRLARSPCSSRSKSCRTSSEDARECRHRCGSRLGGLWPTDPATPTGPLTL